MRIALAQINSTVGDFVGNRKKILDFTGRAKERRCDLVIFPELALFGYSPADLLERPSVVDHQLKEFDLLVQKLPAGIWALVGLVTKNTAKTGRRFHNSAALIRKGKKTQFFHKSVLPNYDVFDEVRHFEPGEMRNNAITINGHKILITICEEIWGFTEGFDQRMPSRNPMLQHKGKKFEAILNLSASPFSINKYAQRRNLVSILHKQFKCPIFYNNMVGGQDEIIFDGGGFVTDKKGQICAQNIFFEEDLNWYDLKSGEGGIHVEKVSTLVAKNKKLSPKNASARSEILRSALVLGIRDYFQKQGIVRTHLGLSGGIDSAVVAALAVDALGPGQVSGFTLEGPFSAAESLSLAHDLAKNLGISILDLSISDVYEKIKTQLDFAFKISDFGIMHENLQSRLRGMMLMAYSNATGSLLLTTGNKSEYATGYATLYGDMCGGLAPIGDLLKEQVYALARLYNSERELIPSRILSRPPTAELRPHQKDSDSLPAYPVLDQAVEKILVNRKAAKSAEEKWLLEKLYATEFKRWQAPPILRVSERAFGRGRRFPLMNKARD